MAYTVRRIVAPVKAELGAGGLEVVELGNTVTVRVTVKNTGNVRHTFYVGGFMCTSYTGTPREDACVSCFTAGPSGTWYEWKHKSVTLNPNEEKTLTFKVIKDELWGGTYHVCFRLWKFAESKTYTTPSKGFIDPDTGKLDGKSISTSLKDCICERWKKNAFSVPVKITGKIIRIYIE